MPKSKGNIQFIIPDRWKIYQGFTLQQLFERGWFSIKYIVKGKNDMHTLGNWAFWTTK